VLFPSEHQVQSLTCDEDTVKLTWFYIRQFWDYDFYIVPNDVSNQQLVFLIWNVGYVLLKRGQPLRHKYAVILFVSRVIEYLNR
jgi:hypothetical protein